MSQDIAPETAGNGFEAAPQIFDLDFAEFMKLQGQVNIDSPRSSEGWEVADTIRAHPSNWLYAFYELAKAKGFAIKTSLVWAPNQASGEKQPQIEILTKQPRKLGNMVLRVSFTRVGRLMHFMSEGLVVPVNRAPTMHKRAFLTSKLFWRYIHGEHYPNDLDQYLKLRMEGIDPLGPKSVMSIVTDILQLEKPEVGGSKLPPIESSDPAEASPLPPGVADLDYLAISQWMDAPFENQPE